MATGFGIALFVFTYGTVAYMVYDEVSGRRARRRSLVARRSRLVRRRRRLELVKPTSPVTVSTVTQVRGPSSKSVRPRQHRS